jgi:photosystem II stability/assembly factor-like uncharacterized protein
VCFVVIAMLAGCGAPLPETNSQPPVTASPTRTPALTPAPRLGGAVPEGFVPKALAFGDPDHGWVAGSTGGRAAFVLETSDAGQTWSASEVGPWVATAIAAASDGAWVSSACPDDEPSCGASLKHAGADGSWEPAAGAAPVALDFAGTTGVVATMLPGGPRQSSGLPIPVIQVTDDAGATWAEAANPCGILDFEAVSLPSAGELLVLCGAEGAGGGQKKALFVSGDLGASWAQRASTDDSLPMNGTKIGFDVATDGSGLWWGARTPAMATNDGGRTWHALGVADGDVRIAGGGAALDGGAGYLLVGDGNRGASLLLLTHDGSSWDERMVWPDPPCCGG